MGRFFNGKVKSDKNTLIRYGVIAGGVLLVIIIVILIIVNSKGSKGILTLNEETVVEVNTKLPDKTKFFKEIEDFDVDDISIDYKDADITKVGSYQVVLSAKGRGSETVNLKVVDTTPPELELRPLTIKYGETYQVESFISSCTDNYDETCTVQFYNNSTDSYGNLIDYSLYREPGNYVILIIAQDQNGNITKPISTSLVIEGQGITVPTTCGYGNLEIPDNLAYPMAVIVGDKINGCALNRELWDDSEVLKTADEFYNKDLKKLTDDLMPYLEDNYPDGAHPKVYPHRIAILNKSYQGLVGYAIRVRVYVYQLGDEPDSETDNEASQNPQNLILEYYLKDDGTRVYNINVPELD